MGLRRCRKVPNVFDMPGQREGPGGSIRTLRKLAGMTLTDVAEAADISVAYLSKVERGDLIPTRAYVAEVTTAIAAHMRGAA
jgi:predicted transcriptional regulator